MPTAAARRERAAPERFDAEHWKTKLIFVSVQLLYTVATLLLAYGLWGSFNLHLAYLLAILACCIWNGGSYYIEVFSKAYRKQFERHVTRQFEVDDATREGLERLAHDELPGEAAGEAEDAAEGALESPGQVASAPSVGEKPKDE